MKDKIKIKCGANQKLEVQLIGGSKPYIWIGGESISGYVNDRSIRKLKRFCDVCLKAKKKVKL